MAKSFQSWAEEKGYEISERQVRYSASMGNRMGNFGSIAGTGGSARTQAGNAMKFLDETFFSTFLEGKDPIQQVQILNSMIRELREKIQEVGKTKPI
jgi:hypothetical protein